MGEAAKGSTRAACGMAAEGLVRDPLGRFSPQALLCTDPAQDAVQVLRWFVQRWQLEVTFREMRDHLGVETQRQWSDKAIARTTPCLLGLFSLVALLGQTLTPRTVQAAAATAWYRKQRPTFVDTLAAVRREIWREQGSPRPRAHPMSGNSAQGYAAPSPTHSATPRDGQSRAYTSG